MLSTILLSVSADTDFYIKWGNILVQRDTGSDLFRDFRWSIIQLLSRLCEACEKLLSAANGSIKFITSNAVKEFVSQWEPVVIGVLTISLFIFGLTLITNPKHDKSKLLQSIILAVFVLIGSTTLIAELTTMTSKYSMELIGSSNTSSTQIIEGNIVDLYYLDSQNWSDSAFEKKNNISMINYIDVNETISAADDVNNPDVFTKYMKLDANGHPILKDIDDGGLVDFNNNTYYRYHIDFITIIITLISTIIVIIFVSFKFVKISLEIVVNHIMLPLLAAADWQTGQKLKEIIKSTLGLFFSIFMCTVCLKLYFMYSAFLSNNKSFTNPLIKALLLIFGAFFVIDGPNVVEKIFGVDAGLASTFRTVSTMFFAARGAAGIAKGATNAVNSMARGAAHLGGGIAGAANGLKNTLGQGKGINAAMKQNAAKGDSIATQGNSGSSSNIESIPSNNSIEGNAKSTDNNASSSPDASSNQDTKSSPVETALSPKASVANAASASNKPSSNNHDYWGNKAKRGNSVVGAAVRGSRNGNYVGEKVGSKINDVREKHEAKNNLKE